MLSNWPSTSVKETFRKVKAALLSGEFFAFVTFTRTKLELVTRRVVLDGANKDWAERSVNVHSLRRVGPTPPISSANAPEKLHFVAVIRAPKFENSVPEEGRGEMWKVTLWK